MNATGRVVLGRTKLQVTRLGLGCAPLGGLYREVPGQQAAYVLDRAFALGIRYFDTAPLYGSGLSEERVGRALRSRDRDSFVLSTKAGRLLIPAAPGERSETGYVGAQGLRVIFDFSYDGVLRSIESSLQRLALDRIDIVLIHDADSESHFEEALRGAYPALHRLRSEGVIRAIGAGMNQWEKLARFARQTDMDCFLLAGRYTLLDQSAMPVLLPLCQENGIGVVIGGPFNSGVLATGTVPGATFDYRPITGALLERVRRIEGVCSEFGVPLKAAALQFPLAHPAVCSVIPGARSVEELEENTRLMDLCIPANFWAALRERQLIPVHAPVPE